MAKTVVVIPTYNEKENIRNLLTELHKVNPELYLMVVDDQSPDGTWKIVEDMSIENPRIILFLRTEKRGRGLAGIAGFKRALSEGADYIIEMDADFSHHPKYIPALLVALEQYDFVLGSRYVTGGQDVERGKVRYMISKMANAYTRIMLGMPVRDCTSGFRAYRREVLEGINLDKINTWGPAVLSDILYRVKLKGFSMGEIPIYFYEREAGSSTLTTQILIEGLRNVARLRLQKRQILETLRT